MLDAMSLAAKKRLCLIIFTVGVVNFVVFLSLVWSSVVTPLTATRAMVITSSLATVGTPKCRIRFFCTAASMYRRFGAVGRSSWIGCHVQLVQEARSGGIK
jgi:hypothetical protein